jgi:TM2 domain-containing membrane protein YozV
VNYYVAEGASQRGPFTEQELPRVGLRPDQLVWCEGMPQWLPANQVPALQSYLNPAPAGTETAPGPSPFPNAPLPSASAPMGGIPSGAAPLPGIAPVGYATPQSMAYPAPGDINGKKIAAGICGILIGTFGVHKFVAGLTGGAVTMLVTSLVCLVLGPFTCGISFFALPVMHIIGLIEGIIYLTKSDAEFYREYAVEKKGWF